jgi:hypothetical protein
MQKGKHSHSPTKVSFEEGVIYLLGGIFVLWLSNAGLVEFGVICLVWFLSLAVRRKKKQKPKHLNPDSDTSSDEYENDSDSEIEDDVIESLIEENERFANDIEKKRKKR